MTRRTRRSSFTVLSALSLLLFLATRELRIHSHGVIKGHLEVYVFGRRAGAFYASARRLRSCHCPRCGYDFRATPDRCPECGTIPTSETKA